MEADGLTYHLDVPYKKEPGPRQKLDFVCPAPTPQPGPLVVYLRGGLWMHRDKSAYTKTIGAYLAIATNFTVAVVNYRNTEKEEEKAGKPAIRAPMHCHDIACALDFCTRPDVSQTYGYDPTRMVIIGHSCGATMAFQLLLLPAPGEPEVIFTDSDAGEKAEAVAARVRGATRGLLMLHGLYDLQTYVETGPSQFGHLILDSHPEPAAYCPTVTVRDRPASLGALRGKPILLYQDLDAWVPGSQSKNFGKLLVNPAPEDPAQGLSAEDVCVEVEEGNEAEGSHNKNLEAVQPGAETKLGVRICQFLTNAFDRPEST